MEKCRSENPVEVIAGALFDEDFDRVPLEFPILFFCLVIGFIVSISNKFRGGNHE